MWPAIIGGALSLGGALLGNSERPTLDPEVMKRLFGPDAISSETNQLYRLLLNSPVFSQIMQGSAMRGTAIANAARGRMAAAGLGGTPMGAWLGAAGSGYGAAFQRSAQADLFMKALMAAMQGLQGREELWGRSQLMRQGQPTWRRMIGASMLNAGSYGLSKIGTGSSTPASGGGMGSWLDQMETLG